MKLFNLLEIRYNQLVGQIKAYLTNNLPSYNSNYGNQTIFGQLINVFSAASQNIMLYIEDALNEQNKYTAQRRKSIYGLAALSGYTPSTGKAASVQLSISFTPHNYSTLNVFINNHESLVCTQNGLNYSLILPQEAIIMSMEKDNSTRYVTAVQGKFESQSFVSTGGKYYTQNFNFLGNLDTDYMNVYINNEKWEKAESFYDLDPDGKQWTYVSSPAGGIDLIFGNGAHGRPLQVNDVIKVEYLLHDGEYGNLDPNQKTYFIFNDNLQDLSGDEVDGNSIFYVTFATTDSVTSGSNAEDLEQVRKMIGYNSRSLVLAQPNNYKAFINRFSFCGYNRTWSEPGSMLIKSIIMKNYKSQLQSGLDYFNLKEKDFVLTQLQKQSIYNCIENTGNQLAGVSYQIIDPEICKYSIYIHIKPKSMQYEKEYINNQVRTLLGEFFSDIKSDIFIPKSDIIQLLKNNIPEIDGIDVYFLSEKNEQAIINKQYVNTAYSYDPSTGLKNKKQEIIYLYDGEDPNLGLDSHGNIFLDSDEQFPVLMGGWKYINPSSNGDQLINVIDPVTIIYE